MRILDTDDLSQLLFDTEASQQLQGRLLDCDEMVLLTVISAEEILRGWLAEIQRHREGRRLVEAYARFQHSLEQLRDWNLLAWTDASGSIFSRLANTAGANRHARPAHRQRCAEHRRRRPLAKAARLPPGARLARREWLD